MRRRLDLAASLVGRPDVLFLDEPTTGLDPRSRIDVWDFIRELQNEGATLLLTTQYLEEADQLADKIAVIDRGALIAEGTSDQLKEQVGGEVLELHVENRDDTSRVVEALKGIGKGDPSIDAEEGKVRIQVGGEGPAALLESVRRLDDTDIRLADIALHRPTLDDVFLKLTGRSATEDEAETDEPTSSRKDRGRRGGKER
jgi:ABC-2 type transport system ATP-binding protein